MFNTNIQKEVLISILKTNLEDHKKIYEEAKVGFLERATAELTKITKDFQNNDGTKSVYINVTAPTNNIKEYERAIRMLELTEDTVIELEEFEFNQLVMDDWGWKKKFLVDNASYSVSAARGLAAY